MSNKKFWAIFMPLMLVTLGLNLLQFGTNHEHWFHILLSCIQVAVTIAMIIFLAIFIRNTLKEKKAKE